MTNSYEADKCDSALTTDCEADAVIDVVKHQITDAEVVEQVPPSPSLVFFLSEHVHADLMCQSCSGSVRAERDNPFSRACRQKLVFKLSHTRSGSLRHPLHVF